MDTEVAMEIQTSQPPGKLIIATAGMGNKNTLCPTAQESEPRGGMLGAVIQLVNFCNDNIAEIMKELDRCHEERTEEANDTIEVKERCAALETKCEELADIRGTLQILLSILTDCVF